MSQKEPALPEHRVVSGSAEPCLMVSRQERNGLTVYQLVPMAPISGVRGTSSLGYFMNST
jgi:hypothetical protein